MTFLKWPRKATPGYSGAEMGVRWRVNHSEWYTAFLTLARARPIHQAHLLQEVFPAVLSTYCSHLLRATSRLCHIYHETILSMIVCLYVHVLPSHRPMGNLGVHPVTGPQLRGVSSSQTMAQIPAFSFSLDGFT
jgi:hypothetical protein